MAKKIAKRRIYGTNPAGREVLVAAAGQEVPDWYDPKPGDVQGPARTEPADDHAKDGPAVTSAKAGPKRTSSRRRKT